MLGLSTQLAFALKQEIVSIILLGPSAFEMPIIYFILTRLVSLLGPLHDGPNFEPFKLRQFMGII